MDFVGEANIYLLHSYVIVTMALSIHGHVMLLSRSLHYSSKIAASVRRRHYKCGAPLT